MCAAFIRNIKRITRINRGNVVIRCFFTINESLIITNQNRENIGKNWIRLFLGSLPISSHTKDTLEAHQGIDRLLRHSGGLETTLSRSVSAFDTMLGSNR